MELLKITVLLILIIIITNLSAFSQTASQTHMNVANLNDITKISSDNNSPDGKFTLQQNRFSNLCAVTTVTFNVAENGKTVLKICDAKGNQVKELVNSVLEQGNYSYTFDQGDLPPGIYYYSLSNENNTYKEKMITLK
jgi:hypothetical protein